MEQLRFNNFTYTISTGENLPTNEIKLVPMLLQPLAENAIWHGLLPLSEKKQLQIRFHKKEDMLICEIEDNGIGIHQSLNNKKLLATTHYSVGIENVRRRIEVLNEKYGIFYRLDIKDKTCLAKAEGHGTVAVLFVKIPQIGDALFN
jgi:sensor histidine kinase YesM